MKHIFTVLLLSHLPLLTTSWTLPIGVDLAWPPLTLSTSGYITINSVQVGDDTPFFPCANRPLTGTEPRVVFPLNTGQFQWNLTNSTHQYAGYWFETSIYIGQVSADTSSGVGKAAYVDDDGWRNITTGMQCGGEKVNATELVNNALGTDLRDAEVVGMNATFGMRTVLFADENYKYPGEVFNIEEMWQCGYVTFVPDDTPKAQFGGVCLSTFTSSSAMSSARSSSTTIAVLGTATGSSPTTTTSTLSTTSGVSFTSSTPTITFTSSGTQSTLSPTLLPIPPIPQSTSTTNTTTVGIAVGLTVGISSLILILCFILLRRRRKQKGTVALDFWTHGLGHLNHEGGKDVKDELDVKGEEKGKGKDDGGKEAGSEFRESRELEELPPYVAEGKSEDVLLKNGASVDG